MIRAVLDANVLASGFVGFASVERAPSRLLRLWRAKTFALVISDHVLAEVLATFEDTYFRKRLTQDQIEAARRLLQDEATISPATAHISGVATHPEDDLVLAAAVGAEVDYLVTGDKNLLRLGAYQGVRILSPREFLDLLEGATDAGS